jgi:hypothetical protein
MANLENCTFENDGVFFTGAETSGDTINDLTPQVVNGVTLPQGVYRRTITANPSYHVSATMFTIAGNLANTNQQLPDSSSFYNFADGGIGVLAPDPPRCWVNEDIFVGTGLGGVGGISSSVMGNGNIAKIWMRDTIAAGDINNKVEVTIKLMDNFVVGDTDLIINLDIDGDAQIYTAPEPPVTGYDVDQKAPFDFLIQPIAFVSFPHRIACKNGLPSQSKQFPSSQSVDGNANDLTQNFLAEGSLNSYIANENGFNTDLYPKQSGFNYFAKPIVQDNILNSTTINTIGNEQIAPTAISESSFSYAYSVYATNPETYLDNFDIETFDITSHNGFSFKNTTVDPSNSLSMLDKSMLANDFIATGSDSGAAIYNKNLSFLLAVDPGTELMANSNFFAVVQVDEITRFVDGSYQTEQDVSSHPFDLNNVDLSIISLENSTNNSVQSALSVKIPILQSFAIGLDTTYNSFEITQGQYVLYRLYYTVLSAAGEGSEVTVGQGF